VRDVELVWLPRGKAATAADFENGEAWDDLNAAIIHAREAKRIDDSAAWIRCDKKFVLSPPDIIAAYPDVKGTD